MTVRELKAHNITNLFKVRYSFHIMFIKIIDMSVNESQQRLAKRTRSSAIAEGPRDASCQLKSCQLPRNSAETTYTTSSDQIDGMKLEI